MLLDTSAWIELFLGTESGIKVRDLLKRERCYTSMSTYSEIVNWALKEGRDSNYFINTIERSSVVLRLTRDIFILAGKLNFERKKLNKKWGMLDSFVLATGLLYNLKILSKDFDFKDLHCVEMI